MHSEIQTAAVTIISYKPEIPPLLPFLQLQQQYQPCCSNPNPKPYPLPNDYLIYIVHTEIG